MCARPVQLLNGAAQRVGRLNCKLLGLRKCDRARLKLRKDVFADVIAAERGDPLAPAAQNDVVPIQIGKKATPRPRRRRKTGS